MEEVVPYCTNVSPPQRGGAIPAPLSERWAEMARQLPRVARPSGRPQSSGQHLGRLNAHIRAWWWQM